MQTKLIVALIVGTGVAMPVMAVAQGFGGDRGPKVEFETLDADGDGRVTEAEIQSFRQGQVTALDANDDGFLSAEEIAAHRSRGQGERAARMVERLDADGDGLLSAAELAVRGDRMGLFGRIDANGDGAVDQAEFDTARERMKERRAERRDHDGPRGDGHRGGKRNR